MPTVKPISSTSGPQLPPAIDVTPGASPTTNDALLPDPTTALESSGDPAAMLAALLVKAGQEAKRGDRQTQAIEEKAQDDAESAEIAAMRQKADDLRSQGRTSGMISVGSGVLTMGAGATFGTREQKAFDGAAKISDGVGHFQDGLAKGEIADDETNARLHEQVANRAKRAVDMAHDAGKDDADFIKTAIDFYREYSGAQTQARGAALHRS
jgi:hypothetical protein